MIFDILEIQKIIEEKRLVWGKKFENFLLAKLKFTLDFLQKNFLSFFQSKYFLPISCGFIVLSSFFLRRSFSYSPDLSFEILTNLIGIITIYFCATIIDFVDCAKQIKDSPPKSFLATQTNLKKIFLLAFCFIYFIRPFDFFFSENIVYNLKLNCLLALLFSYVATILTTSSNSTIISVFFAAFIIYLDFRYILFIAFLEIQKSFIDQSKFFTKETAQRLAIPALLAIFLISQHKFNLANFSPENFYFNIFSFFKEIAFAFLLFFSLNFSIIKRNNSLKILFLASLVNTIIAIFSADLLAQKMIFLTLALPLLFAIIFFWLSEAKTNFRDAILLLLCLILPQFDKIQFFDFALNLCLFWWVILLLQKKINYYLYALAFLSITLTFLKIPQEISWLFCAIIFIILLGIFAKKHPLIKMIAAFLCLSYILSLYNPYNSVNIELTPSDNQKSSIN